MSTPTSERVNPEGFTGREGLNPSQQPREVDGKFAEKEGSAPEVTLTKRGIPKEISDFEAFVDLAVGRELSRGEESRLDILYYKLEALRVRHEGDQILSVYRTLDPDIDKLHVVAGNGSDGYSAELYGIVRKSTGPNTVHLPTATEISVFDSHCRALKVPEAMEGVYERSGEQDDYLRDIWVVTDEAE